MDAPLDAQNDACVRAFWQVLSPIPLQAFGMKDPEQMEDTVII